MDDFRPSGFLDGDTFLVPPGAFELGEPTRNNQLAGDADLALPSQHPSMRDNEELLPEVQYYSPIHHRVGIVNPPQEYPFLHDWHHVYTHSAVSTAGPVDVEPSPFDNNWLTVPLTVGHGMWEDNSGISTFPAKISGISNHGPMTPQAQQQSPVTLNDNIEIETGQDSDSKLRCPECGKKFHAKKAITRHRDDVHSVTQNCPHSKCKIMLKGKRKLEYHLSRHHKGVLPN